MEPDSDPDPGLRYQLKKKLNINLEKNYFLSSNHIYSEYGSGSTTLRIGSCTMEENFADTVLIKSSS